MPEASDLPFAFLRDMLAQGGEPDDDAGEGPRSDPATESGKAALLDATVGVLAALRQLLQAAEDIVRVRRDRLGSDAPDASPPRSSSQSGRERLDLSY